MVFKCKMCGGDIEVVEGSNIGKCLYCKSTMTLPSVDNEKLLNLYNRANNLRLSNEFDKAYGVYETILEIDENQLEAHWGLILCRYGVEYVDDPKTKKKMITCHRTKYESVLTDPDYKIIISKAYGDALNIYKEEAKTISNIQKKALEISNNEEDYDIFICYKEGDINGDRTPDSVIAQDIYNKLTDLNYKVFFARITLADKLGEEYEPYIFSALNSSKVMLVVGTNTDNLNSVWVKNEWSRYLDLIKNKKKKVLIPVYSKMDAYELPEEFSMLQALCIDKVGSMQDLITAVGKIINKKSTDIDSDMYQKFKQMMLEEEREKQEELSKRYDVIEKRNKCSTSYIVITFVLSAMMAVYMICLCGRGYYNYLGETFGIASEGKNFFSYQFLVGIITAIAFFLGFASRKSNKISKYMYIVNVFLELLFILKLHNFGNVATFVTYIIILLNIALLLMKPSWEIKEVPLIVTKEEKEEILKNNKEFTENYIPKDKKILNIFFYILPFIIGIISVIINTSPLPNQSNDRNTSIDQIKVIADHINIRSDDNVYSYEKGIVRKDDIYDVLDSREGSNGLCEIWYNIETSFEVNGWICGKFDNKDYVVVLEKE